jgi:DNA polymerase sigma
MKFHDFCITEIKRLIQETLNFSNDYIIEVYGSYATGLMIEASDIDIKIKLNKGTKDDLNSFFKKVCEKLEQEKKFDEINPIETASVPVIKLLLSKEKFIKGKTDLENSYKQYKELSLFKHYLFDINELTKIKIDVTFILPKDNLNNNIKEEINNINNNIENNINDIHDHNKSIESELSSVSYVKEQIVKYPEVKFILRVLKRYFYYKKMNTAFLGGLSSYNLFLLLLSYAKFLKLSPNSENTNLGYFLFHFLYFFKVFDFKQYIININSKNNIYDILPPESAKEFNLGKSIVIIDPLTGVNASKSSYKIDDIQNTFSEAFDFFQNEEIKYGKEGKTKVNKKNSNNDKTEVMGLPKSNKNENNHGGGNIIEKFLGK